MIVLESFLSETALGLPSGSRHGDSKGGHHNIRDLLTHKICKFRSFPPSMIQH